MADQPQASLPALQPGRLVYTAQDEEETGKRTACTAADTKWTEPVLEHGLRGGSALSWALI